MACNAQQDGSCSFDSMMVLKTVHSMHSKWLHYLGDSFHAYAVCQTKRQQLNKPVQCSMSAGALSTASHDFQKFPTGPLLLHCCYNSRNQTTRPHGTGEQQPTYLGHATTGTLQLRARTAAWLSTSGQSPRITTPATPGGTSSSPSSRCSTRMVRP